jgi:hypothetical protein
MNIEVGSEIQVADMVVTVTKIYVRKNPLLDVFETMVCFTVSGGLSTMGEADWDKFCETCGLS